MTSFGPIFLTAVQSVLQLFIMMGVGIYFQRYLHILGFHLRKEMSAIVFSVALPCLLVTKIAYSIDLSDAMVLLVVPLFTVLHLSLSYLFALIGARFLGPCFSPAFHQGHYKATSMLGNAGTVPFMITASVMRMHPWDVERPSSEQEAASVALSIGLVSLYIVLVSPAMWSIGYPVCFRSFAEIQVLYSFSLFFR
jgi:predicted permease